MNIQKGKTYKTKNGGTVRIIADDRASTNGKHWVGLYDGTNGEWVLTYDIEGNAYVFDGMKPELSLAPETRKWWFVTYRTSNDSETVRFCAWNADIFPLTQINNIMRAEGRVDIRTTFVEQQT